MDIQLNNSWDYKQGDRWDWSAYITGNDVDKVGYVEYILHPTFTKPVVKITDPTDGFRLETDGWGTFELRAIAHFKDGTQQLLRHELRLEYRPKSGRTDAG
jgi:transcription initiation factor IIF auxiliary subunit